MAEAVRNHTCGMQNQVMSGGRARSVFVFVLVLVRQADVGWMEKFSALRAHVWDTRWISD